MQPAAIAIRPRIRSRASLGRQCRLSWSSYGTASRATPPAPRPAWSTTMHASAKMGSHRDEDEEDKAAPVVSISLGDDATFHVGGLRRSDPKQRLVLRSGDVFVLGGAGTSRLPRHRPHSRRHVEPAARGRPLQSHPAAGDAGIKTEGPHQASLTQSLGIANSASCYWRTCLVDLGAAVPGPVVLGPAVFGSTVLATHRQALAPASTGALPAGQTQLPPFTVPPPQLIVAR